MNAIQNYVWGRSKPFVYNYDKIRYRDINSNKWGYMNYYNNNELIGWGYEILLNATGMNNEYIIFDPNPIAYNTYSVVCSYKYLLKELDLSIVRKLSNLSILGCNQLEKIFVHQDVMNKLSNNTIKLKREEDYKLNSFYVPNHITLANFFVKS